MPPRRPLGRDTARTVATKPHWEALIPAAPHTFRGTSEAVEVSPRIYTYCPGGFQNQTIGDCVGMSTANAVGTVLRIPPAAVFDPADPSRDSPRGPNVRLSELWCYYWARNLHGDPGPGDGAVVAYSMDAVMKVGVVLAAHWPATPETEAAYSDRAAPPEALALEGSAHPVLAAARITSRQQYLDFLAQGYPVVDGVEINDGWESTAPDGAFSLNGKSLGGHATVTVGFDKRLNRLYKRNSWGRWGARTDDPEFDSDDPAYLGNAGGFNMVGYCPLDQYLDLYVTDKKLGSGETDAFVVSRVGGFDRPRIVPVSAEVLFT